MGTCGAVYQKTKKKMEFLWTKDLGKILDIKTGFKGSTVSNIAKLNFNGLADYINDMHVPEWTRMCQEAKINNTPLTPYIDKELLYKNDLKIDGSKITKDSSFTYKREFGVETIKEQISSFIEQEIFPEITLH